MLYPLHFLHPFSVFSSPLNLLPRPPSCIPFLVQLPLPLSLGLNPCFSLAQFPYVIAHLVFSLSLGPFAHNTPVLDQLPFGVARQNFYLQCIVVSTLTSYSCTHPRGLTRLLTLLFVFVFVFFLNFYPPGFGS